MFFRTLLAASFVLLLSVSVDAQMFNPRGRQQQQPAQPQAPATEEGTIQSISQGVIKMVNKANQPFFVGVTPNTAIHVTGVADLDYIRKGVLVQFTADVDSKHSVKEKISHLTVFSATREKGPGLLSADTVEGGASDSFMPAQDTGPKTGSHGKADNHKTSTSGHKPAAVKLPATCIVRGKVTSCQSGKLLVVAGRGGKIDAELADEVAIRVDLADLSAASKGDAISVQGRNMPGRQGAPTVMQAETITITAAQPLSSSGGKKKAGHSTHPAKKTGDDKAPKPSGDKDKLGGAN